MHYENRWLYIENGTEWQKVREEETKFVPTRCHFVRNISLKSQTKQRVHLIFLVWASKMSFLLKWLYLILLLLNVTQTIDSSLSIIGIWIPSVNDCCERSTKFGSNKRYHFATADKNQVNFEWFDYHDVFTKLYVKT